MHADDYVGWLALALTPGLGARMAGKLLGELGSPDAIFSASLTATQRASRKYTIRRRSCMFAEMLDF